MMNTNYYPSKCTLTLMDGFGTRKKWWGTRTTQQSSVKHCENKMPQFARRKVPAFDKQNLLEQIRQQKKKNKAIRSSTANLLRSISKTKLTTEQKTAQNGKIVSSKMGLMKREIELISQQLGKQKQTIEEIKHSKKYNRFMELTAMKNVYQEQLKELKIKLRSYKYELAKIKKGKKCEKKRSKGIGSMNNEIAHRLYNQNVEIQHQTKQLCDWIETEKVKVMERQREKTRLMRQIYQLQKMTGVLYLKEDNQPKEEQINSSREKDQKQQSLPSSHNNLKLNSYGNDFENDEEEDETEKEEKVSDLGVSEDQEDNDSESERRKTNSY